MHIMTIKHTFVIMKAQDDLYEFASQSLSRVQKGKITAQAEPEITIEDRERGVGEPWATASK